MTRSYDLIVIGAGMAGVSAANKVRVAGAPSPSPIAELAENGEVRNRRNQSHRR